MKLGSLFDGSGGFPFAAQKFGIEPVWASEINKFCIGVTSKNFPNMIHLGDIKNIDGSKIEPVDIISFSSPCQDLSEAGKKKGVVEGERSSLFFDAIRIVKEMREATDNMFPKYLVWENVHGCLGSNKGNDFYEILKAFAGLIGKENAIPESKCWNNEGIIEFEEATLAWRLFNSRYWGCPQNRTRIYIVFSFGDRRPAEILFDERWEDIKAASTRTERDFYRGKSSCS